VHELRKMVRYFTLPAVRAYMRHVQDNAAESVRRVIDRLHDSSFTIETDQGSVIKVRIAVDKKKREATVDFTGTSPQQVSNFNAPEPVTRAAVLYVFRVMVDDDIPMNAGCLRPIRIVIPKRSMLSPEFPAAVVAGNVETSQEVTNCLFGALGAMAAAQGTMNNLNFGNARYQYYETICSGSPAGPGFPGTDAVHTHMTNTRLTDPEILEFRYPVLLEDFTSAKAPAAAASGTPATASAAPSASWKRWSAPFCRVTAAWRRSDWRAAATAMSARMRCAEAAVRSKSCKAATLPSSTPVRRSSSKRRPRAATASRNNSPHRRRGRHRRRFVRRTARHRIFHVRRAALPIEGEIDGDVGAIGQRQHGAAHDVVFGR